MKNLLELSKEITEWRYTKGFHTPTSISTVPERNDMLGKLMLVVSEVAEAAEAVRKNNQENFEEELADTFIRLLDICGAMEIDIDMVIEDKMRKNMQREKLHGKQTTL